jgi:hypothetical protein
MCTTANDIPPINGINCLGEVSWLVIPRSAGRYFETGMVDFIPLPDLPKTLHSGRPDYFKRAPVDFFTASQGAVFARTGIIRILHAALQ